MNNRLIAVSAFLCSVFFVSCGETPTTPDNPDDNDKPGVKSYISLTPTTKTVDGKAGKFTVYAYSNADWTVDLQGNDWLTPDVTSGSKKGKVVFSYESGSQQIDSEVRFNTVDGNASAVLKVKREVATFRNPIGEVPDPWITKVNGEYWFCKSLGNGLGVSSSYKLTTINSVKRIWTTPTDVSGVKNWNAAEVWAPELHYIDGKWYIYYTAGRPQSEQGNYYLQRCGVLVCEDSTPLTTNWKDMGMLYTGDSYYDGIVPTAANTEYAIDLTVCKINGELYAIWSGGSNGTDVEQAMYIAKMSDPTKICSSRVKISSPSEKWETVLRYIQEGPATLYNDGKTYLVYSTNGSWTKYYRLGWLCIADGSDPLKASSWTKSKSEVFYRCDDSGEAEGVNGVGHCCFTKSPDDSEDWIVYHAKTSSKDGWGKREAYAKKFGWNADGSPDFGTPVGYGEYIPVPAGQ